MRPIKAVLNAAGYSQWVPIDYVAAWFGATVAVTLSEDANLTYTVQHSFDEPYLTSPYSATSAVTISRTTTTATVTDSGPEGIGHGLKTGDSVIVKGSGSTNLDSGSPTYGRGDVGFNVASTPSSTTYTYTVSNSGATADTGNAHVTRLRVFASSLASQTTRGSVTYNYPIQAVRLYISSYSAGFADMTVLQGSPR